ncbi:hypothetical protein ESY86_05915 [Subsaximicrobium wynnwilliamsii]|uniref:Selenophosphate synthetase n=1 Tax=Subsaximicrobium wynnwilliamsii TaxID=291179 RepID=A0A5C6ZNL2_9FLAO|nr:hypothetical protein [Subsaximicrobium wynnwilliamsii]TXD84588.1 hypothetical protein ESY87_05690 [Subsaximicrobium wynnwilliamsii]TXD90270.1 hypothetical protein ESY86_05915 [Subsaximicrobium wynnwilliamsii]TXE04321.1 hypothetical protein ESY88_05685 [Subsaximicrobium wynnwilliamsii]
MIRTLTCIALFSVMLGCKSETKKTDDTSANPSEEKVELTAFENIAKAYGIDKWKDVKEIDFTFNVDTDGKHFQRAWQWQPKTNDVVMMTEKDTVRYNRASVDSLSLKADQAFINDKFWLLSPFQLVWDEDVHISVPVKEAAPISKTQLNKITLTYLGDQGYTPGDAYDFFYDDDYMIKEWNYRKGNSETPTMSTTFENHEDFDGIKIAKDHKKADADWNLFFSDIKIK